jgi:hypothetical protein
MLSFVKACFVRALLGLFNLMLSEFSSFVWDHVLSEHFFSYGSSFCLSFLSFMRAHVRASRFLWKFIFYEPFFVCVNSCPQILLLLKIILMRLNKPRRALTKQAFTKDNMSYSRKEIYYLKINSSRLWQQSKRMLILLLNTEV